MKLKELVFATSNRGKFREIAQLASSYGLKVKMAWFKAVEIQHESLKEIARYSLKQALRRFDAPVFVEDAGLFIEVLNGFPGPYSSYVYKTLGVEGVLKLLEGKKNRRAYFLSVIAFGGPDFPVKVFLGKSEGTIAFEARGRSGFGFDPIFQPQGSSRTFAEMGVEGKNRYSHRARAFRRLAEWLKKRLN